MNSTEVKLIQIFRHVIDDARIPQEYYQRKNPTSTREEQLVAISSVSKDRIIERMTQIKNGNMNDFMLDIPFYSGDKHHFEYFGDRIQIVVSACIHCDNEILMLKLKKAADTTDGYSIGTLTYPQGHLNAINMAIKGNSNMSTSESNRSGGTTQIHLSTTNYSSLILECKQAILRELDEEIGYLDSVIYNTATRASRCHQIIEMSEKTIHPIYVNFPGNTELHLNILFDIEMANPDEFHMLASSEIDKHEVVFITYDDLAKLPDLDKVCVWVKDSFRKIPFFAKTFFPYK